MSSVIEQGLATLDRNRTVERIWKADHTVWKPDPAGLVDRLGWLTIDARMAKEAASLERFGEQARAGGLRHVVLLGMGGSSLGAEVIGQVFGPARNARPELLVLDSTVPAAIVAVRQAIDPGKTIFLVSSKSGGTIDTKFLYSYFRSETEAAIGNADAGKRFVAITDSGTSLERLASEAGFRRAFGNDPSIGGRYSVLSYFGLVPAALLGIDLTRLLGRAQACRESCAAGIPLRDNPGTSLGAAIGAWAAAGRNKLSLITSPRLASMGTWIEQLVAESTGKEGRGVIPVAGEPIGPPAWYSDDRLFVYMRLAGDGVPADEAKVTALEKAGHPVLRTELRDAFDLGAEFYRWEYAIAVAGSMLKINPFDQPDVQSAKDQTDRVLGAYARAGVLPARPASLTPAALVQLAKPGGYLAITAFMRQTAETDRLIAVLRRRIMERHRIATTLGYGPRFLHSTGQLHKGGPAGGLFLQLTAKHNEDLPIPGMNYTFGTFADAQSLGDHQALVAGKRQVAWFDLGGSPAKKLEELASTIA